MGYGVEETPQSRQGHYFVGPGGEKYPNKGCVSFSAKDELSRDCITKLHMAVSS